MPFSNIKKLQRVVFYHFEARYRTGADREVLAAGLWQIPSLHEKWPRIHLLLLDCPPSLSLLTVNALVASDYCLIPIESGSKYSLDGYEDLEELIRDVRDVNPKLDILGVLITRHDGRKNVCKAMKVAIERRFGAQVFQTAITSSAKIQEAEASKRSIFQHDRQSNGARDFMALGREVLTRLQLHIPVSSNEVQDYPSGPVSLLQ